MNGIHTQIDRLSKAVVLACRLHGNDTRDDGKTPYAVHPLRVMEYLRRLTGERDENVLCAALLHDTIEDTGIDFDTLAEEFGEDVASLVAELTNDNRLPKDQRRAAMIAHAGQTGNVTSPQLHFEIRKGSTPVDPTQFLGASNS